MAWTARPGFKACQKCGRHKARDGYRFCVHCAANVRAAMVRSGYLTPEVQVPWFRGEGERENTRETKFGTRDGGEANRAR